MSVDIQAVRIKVVRTTQNKLARERQQFNPNSAGYKRRMEQSQTVDADTLDNLVKMTKAIVKNVDIERLSQEFGDARFNVDNEAQSIEQRITRSRAEELLKAWFDILRAYDSEEGKDACSLFAANAGGDMTQSLLEADVENPELQDLKDKLFIQTGEDQFDTFTAFKHYRLNHKFTAADRV